MVIYKCKMCNGDLDIHDDSPVAICQYCGSRMTLPTQADQRKADQFNRANHYRRNCEFDRAADAYTRILDEFPREAEAFWGLLLCRYGIEYVEDRRTQRRIPTCHRTHSRSILQDADYLQTLETAPPLARIEYEREAKEIDRLQKEILQLAAKEPPYDVFISYKEKDDATGQRTRDSVLAQEIYNELTRQGKRVFFSRITLEDKLGQQYEPIIYSALRSARVMIVVGTTPAYVNAVWVKNEWSRFLGIMAEDKGKHLIPVYRDMDPYDLPDELSSLQALNMANLGFLQDLVRGIDKLMTGTRKPAGRAAVAPAGIAAGTVSGENLLTRARIELDVGNYDEAREYCKRASDLMPTDPEPYWMRLLCENKVKNDEELLANIKLPLQDFQNFGKAYRFASSERKKQLEAMAQQVLARLEQECEETHRSLLEQQTMRAKRLEEDSNAKHLDLANARTQLREQQELLKSTENRYNELSKRSAALQEQLGQYRKPTFPHGKVIKGVLWTLVWLSLLIEAFMTGPLQAMAAGDSSPILILLFLIGCILGGALRTLYHIQTYNATIKSGEALNQENREVCAQYLEWREKLTAARQTIKALQQRINELDTTTTQLDEALETVQEQMEQTEAEYRETMARYQSRHNVY